MNFLNTAISQISDLFKSMSAGARITAGLLLVLVVVSLGYLIRFPSNAPNDYLLGGRAFSSTELAAMEAAFSQSALNNYTIEGNRVRVPRSQRSSYLAAMAENRALPRDFDEALGESKGSPWESEQARRERVQRAKQDILGLAIRKMPGISQAIVQIDERKTGGFRSSLEVTASVNVAALGNGKIDPQIIEAIRYLVAAAKAGLTAANITVTDLTSGITYPGGGSDGTANARNNAYSMSVLRYQSEREKKALEILSYIPGIQVVASAELDPTLQTQQETLLYDTKAVAFDTTSDTQSETTTNASEGGRVGTAANTGTTVETTETSSAGGSVVEASSEHIRSRLSPTHTLTVIPGLVPRRLTFSVSVPSTYYRQVQREQWLDNNELEEGGEVPTPTDADMVGIRADIDTKIENILIMLMPGDDASEDKRQLVTVTSFQSLSVEQPDPPGMMDKATVWLGTNWSMLGMLLIGGAGLVMLRGLVRNVPSTEVAPTPSSPALHLVSESTEGEPVEEEESPHRVKRRFSASGPNVKEDLADMVREDPETAVNILKSWIGDAA